VQSREQALKADHARLSAELEARAKDLDEQQAMVAEVGNELASHTRTLGEKESLILQEKAMIENRDAELRMKEHDTANPWTSTSPSLTRSRPNGTS